VQGQYIGVDEQGKKTIDDRLTVVLQDEAKSFWPVIMKLSDADVGKFISDLELAIKNRTADLKDHAGKCAPEPAGLEAILGFQGSKLDDNGHSTFNEGRFQIQPIQPGTPHLPVELSWLIKTPRSPMTNFGSVRMSVPEAQSLLALVNASTGQRKNGGAAVELPAKSDSEIRIYTRLLELDQFGACQMGPHVRLRAMSHYRGVDETGVTSVDRRLTIVLEDSKSRMWHMIAKLGAKDAKAFTDQLEAAIAARKGESPAGVAAMIATRPYTIAAPGMITLPAGVTLEAMPAYTSSGPDNVIKTEDRVTVIVKDAANSFWPMVVRMDAPAAQTLLTQVKAAMLEGAPK
jgi:hypothetical protein